MSGGRTGQRRRLALGLASLACALVLATALAIVPEAAGQGADSPPGKPHGPAPGGWGAKVSPTGPKRRPRMAPPAGDTAESGQGPSATAVELREEEGRTRFLLTLSAPVAFQVYTLDNPYRVVIDAADLAFRLPPASGQTGRGVIGAFRYGLLAPGRSRIVLDARSAMRIEAAQLMTAGPQGPHALVLDILPVEAAAFTRTPLPEAQPPPEAPPPAPSKGGARSRRIVVLDPGHGGIDPGTQGAVVREKDIVLAVSHRVRALLEAAGRYDVRMTRKTDAFVSLDERVRISTRSDASLFISIHADSIGELRLAQAIRGASVYTLAERASSEVARRLAEKENAADLVAGLDATHGAESDQVRNILFDLMRRETANLSAAYRARVIANLKKAVAVSREPSRSAAFKVLQQPQSPSVLIELGYMSNAQDEELMRTEAWQQRVASAIARAVEEFFASQPPLVQK